MPELREWIAITNLKITNGTVAVASFTPGTTAPDGSVTVPAEVVPMADHVVWLPAAGLPRADTTPPPGAPYPGVRGGAGSTVYVELGAGHGATVTLRRPE